MDRRLVDFKEDLAVKKVYTLMPTNFFFDAHFHPTLKKHFAGSKPDSQGRVFSNPWTTAVTKDFIKELNGLQRCALRPLVEHSLASLSQLNDNQFKLGVAALFFPDKGLMRLITDSKAFMKLINKGKLGELLVGKSFEALKESNDAFITVQRDLELLKSANAGGQEVGMLKDSTFQPNPEDLPQLAFSLEGLHCLRSDLRETNPEKVIRDILTNLDALRSRNIRILFINPVHIDDSNELFANQAYAMDAFRIGGFDEKHLRPKGNGLTEAGKQMIKELHSREILVDVKHMGWIARRQLYAFRKAKNITAPLVCSHAGFTGCWFDNPGGKFSDYILAPPDTEGPHGIRLNKANPYLTDNSIGFNVSSINLFNEDILAIFQSDGLIGISLDQRVLGYSDVVDIPNGDNDPRPEKTNVIRIADGQNGELILLTDTDYISPEEFKAEKQFRTLSQNPDIRKRGVFARKRRINVADLHAWHFYLHIVHAIQVARIVGGEDAAHTMLTRTLCIGSDFDGLIDGLDCCPDMGHIGALKQKFIKEFAGFLNEIRTPLKITLPDGLSVEQVADRIFYENGRDFVLRRLEAMNKNSVRPGDVIV
jgi:hypothetical protein